MNENSIFYIISALITVGHHMALCTFSHLNGWEAIDGSRAIDVMRIFLRSRRGLKMTPSVKTV